MAQVGSQSEWNYHCKHQVCGENKNVQSLPHIQGTYPKTELLRNATHHKIRSTLDNRFRTKKLEVYEEIHCETVRGSEIQNRRTDIIIIDRKKNSGFVFDLTTRYETNPISTQDEDTGKTRDQGYMYTASEIIVSNQ